MLKKFASLFFVFFTQCVFAEGYDGVGVGLSEACRTKYQPSFSGGDCISANLDIHGLIGNQLNDYFSIEGTVDFAFDAGNIIDIVLGGDDEDNYYSNDSNITTNRWSILTMGVHPLFHLPLTNSFGLFAGPSFGGSMVVFDYDVKYFGNNSLNSSTSSTEFGLNYGWTAGININDSDSGALRLQWQNWRSLDADVAENKEFSSNTLTLSMISYF
ncbi:MAG: hypothetical protein EOO52_16180 [Gammaproteobacteria bacterium]|nr:MAG: hypothetical protein EOO52_16180 [Gammaproteobacteria bacterium]